MSDIDTLRGSESRDELIAYLERCFDRGIPMQVVDSNVFALDLGDVTKVVILPEDDAKKKSRSKISSIEKLLKSGVTGKRTMMERKGGLMYLNVRGSKIGLPATKRKPIMLRKFEEKVLRMRQEDGLEYQVEYQALDHVGRSYSADAAGVPPNRKKNRFFNILPYDHSRVVLSRQPGDPTSDYINANYMMGYNSAKEYIVCQGPMENTLNDHWRMILENKVKAIVMLTRCVEDFRPKCACYWPVDEEPVCYGDIEVEVIEETKFENWNITNLLVKNQTTGESRTIPHYHYLSWRDFNAPSEYDSLITFIRIVRSKVKPEDTPTLVHCSAGVGRSGTYIALDRCIQHMKQHDSVDVFGTVVEMRQNRRFMVQRLAQYEFIYETLLHVLRGRDQRRYDYGL